MTISLVYTQKMATAANSPRKQSALKTFVPLVVNAQDPAMEHPAKRCLKSSSAFKHDHILVGMAAVLLTMKKPDRIVPISLLLPSPTFSDQFLGHGHHLLRHPVCIHIQCGKIANHVLSLMSKRDSQSYHGK
jgi:hypothetical protein